MSLTAGQLAQFRGCDPINDCYWECVSWAADTIREGSERWELDELAEAWIWAKTQTWTPPLADTEGAQP